MSDRDFDHACYVTICDGWRKAGLAGAAVALLFCAMAAMGRMMEHG